MESGSEGEAFQRTDASANIAEDEDIPNEGVLVSGVPSVVGMGDVGRHWAALEADLSRDAQGKQQQLLTEIAWDLEKLQNEEPEDAGDDRGRFSSVAIAEEATEKGIGTRAQASGAAVQALEKGGRGSGAEGSPDSATPWHV